MRSGSLVSRVALLIFRDALEMERCDIEEEAMAVEGVSVTFSESSFS
jgi:hypothetical protein